jgi:hypothetical protein
MGYGKWSERFGGKDQPYEFVDLYDQDSGQIYTWSVPQNGDLEGDRAEVNSETEVSFTLEKRLKPAQSVSKKDGQVYEHVRESLQARVVGFKPAPSRAKSAVKAA